VNLPRASVLRTFSSVSLMPMGFAVAVLHSPHEASSRLDRRGKASTRGKVLGLFYPQSIFRKWVLAAGQGEGGGFGRRRGGAGAQAGFKDLEADS
jgi:hypothetical protein